MFKNLYRKIYIPITVIGVVLILFIDTFTIILQANTLNEAYRSMGEKRIARAMDSFQLYLSSAAAFTYNLSLDTEIIEKLNSPDAKPITDKLNTVCNQALKMDAVSVYSLDGSVYTSSTVTQAPALDELKSDTAINNFLTDDSAETISMRTKHIADIYNNVLYPENMGVISICRKVYDGGELKGIILTDILPANLYGYIFAEGQFKDAIAFIYSDNGYFEYNDNSSHEKLLTEKNSRYFKYSEAASNGLFTISVFDSRKEYNSSIIQLVLIMLGISVLLMIFVVVTARIAAKNVTARLDKLIEKMSSQDIP